jgi:hypothetical protein
VPGELVGLFVNPDLLNSLTWYVIADNTADEIRVWGRFDVSCINPQGCFNQYELHDLRPGGFGSTCVDTADDGAVHVPTFDVLGQSWVDVSDGGTEVGIPGTVTDRGAYELP